jgi:hypothetical protein
MARTSWRDTTKRSEYDDPVDEPCRADGCTRKHLWYVESSTIDGTWVDAVCLFHLPRYVSAFTTYRDLVTASRWSEVSFPLDHKPERIRRRGPTMNNAAGDLTDVLGYIPFTRSNP